MSPAVKRVLGGIALLVVIFALWKVPEWQLAGVDVQGPKRVELVDQARRTLAQIFGGLFLLIGLYFTWRRITATERNVEIAQEGQITERFTRAIEQIGNDKIEIRLGGIYALERIARDSEKDHWPIMEVLTAYIREHAPWREDEPPKDDKSLPNDRFDIQAILTVIGRRRRTYKKGEDDILQLGGVDLRGVNLTGAHLEGALLWGTHLDNSSLMKAHLKEAFLMKAHLKKALLIEADLEGAYLREANLDGAILSRAILKRANLSKANLEGAILVEANLEAADMEEALALTKDQIESAIIDEHTKLPDYLKGSTEGKAGEGGK